MTDIVAVPAKVDPLPFPTLADKPAGVYNQKAYAWAQRHPLVADAMFAQAESVFTNATATFEKAEIAQAAAQAATGAQAGVTQSANTATAAAGAAQGSASAAAGSATLSQDNNVDFQSRMLGAKTSAPATDNFGQPLRVGAIYINSTNNTWNWWTGTAWQVGLSDPDLTIVDWVSVQNTPTTLAGYGITDALTSSGTIAKANALNTARSLLVNLASTSGASFDGTANATMGVSGILGIANGGHGASTAAQGLANLGGVSLSGTQTINGAKTFSSGITSNGDVTAFSDERLKKDVRTIEDAMQLVLSMRGVRYKLKAEEGGRDYMGFIAQELDGNVPELVRTHETGMLTVAYANAAPILAEAIKYLYAEIEQLKGNK